MVVEAAAHSAAGSPTPGSKRFLGKGRKYWRDACTGWAMALPWVIGFLVFTAVPMVLSFYYCFTYYNVVEPPRWMGLYNFQFLPTWVYFQKAIYNTLYYVTLSQPLAITGSLFLAILMNQKVPGRAVFRTIYYLPSVLSGVATAMLWLWLLNPRSGIVNVVLRSMGLPAPNWLFDEYWAKPALVLMRMWALGSGAVIFLAGLQGIPEHLHEAAQVDGAGRWRRFWSVTLPMLSPTMFFQVVTGFIGAFQMFAPIYVWTAVEAGTTATVGAGPQDSLLMYALLLYRMAFGSVGGTSQNMGRASAMAWMLFIFILILTIAQFRLARRWVYYEAGPEGGI